MDHISIGVIKGGHVIGFVHEVAHTEIVVAGLIVVFRHFDEAVLNPDGHIVGVGDRSRPPVGGFVVVVDIVHHDIGIGAVVSKVMKLGFVAIESPQRKSIAAEVWIGGGSYLLEFFLEEEVAGANEIAGLAIGIGFLCDDFHGCQYRFADVGICSTAQRILGIEIVAGVHCHDFDAIEVFADGQDFIGPIGAAELIGLQDSVEGLAEINVLFVKLSGIDDHVHGTTFRILVQRKQAVFFIDPSTLREGSFSSSSSAWAMGRAQSKNPVIRHLQSCSNVDDRCVLNKVYRISHYAPC